MEDKSEKKSNTEEVQLLLYSFSESIIPNEFWKISQFDSEVTFKLQQTQEATSGTDVSRRGGIVTHPTNNDNNNSNNSNNINSDNQK